MYRKVMESPGYTPERELVIQAPDGTYVAFTVTWHDHLNRTGLFEPVGTHKDYRRRGFGGVIILYGMQGMAAAGWNSLRLLILGITKPPEGFTRPVVLNHGIYRTDIKKHILLQNLLGEIKFYIHERGFHTDGEAYDLIF